MAGSQELPKNPDESSKLFNNALQFAVTTALRLVDLTNKYPEEKSTEVCQRVSPLPEIPLDQVSWHDNSDDCWIVLYDRVYEVTDFLKEHPGGTDVLLEYAGRDATLAYRGFGHSTQAWQMLQKYLIGVLPEKERTGIFKEETMLLGRNRQLKAATS